MAVVDDIIKIPGFMRAKKWFDGAALMDKWFQGAPNNDPAKGSPDTTTIKMDWVLSFSRAQVVFDEMIRDKVWMNPAAQRVLSWMLRKKGLLIPTVSRFGNLNAPAPAVHNDQVNFRTVGTGALEPITDPLDDMFAALGRFALYVAVAGTVNPAGPKRYRVDLTEVGIYVRDSYDFNGEQLLGFWNFSTGDVSKLPLWFTYSEVSNKTFRDWRDKNKKGGDFYVYSDVRIVKLNLPQSFTISE